ncbi:hypothetical protein PRZ48_009903 [Zasmidium cellare]|uniref:F-box domain-containing protein n=1 Tax=Zasmidium cellare TaxID=395010 RepID=A0ABR0ED09_ZASCE|nr:hypothetical protein PRZ48_009903 [Zasmidium cellare]
MVDEGLLTKSGLLFEGNFPGWRVRINAILKMHDLDRVLSQPLHHARHASQQRKAADIIANHVSPALFKRVPLEKRTNPRLLWRSLKMLAKPFRLLDLPDEVRNRICRFAVEDQLQDGPPPALAKCSRRLREEVTPLWMSNRHFHLSFDHDALSEDEAFEDCARAWFRRLGTQNIKFIRHLEIFLDGTTAGGSPLSTTLTLTVSPQSGFRMSARAHFVGGDKLDWQVFLAGIRRSMKGVEADRKILGLQGESMLLALTSKSSTWVKEWKELLTSVELDEEFDERDHREGRSVEREAVLSSSSDNV